MIRLQIHSGNRNPVSVELPRGVYTIGSDEQCAIVVDRPGVAPRQLEITVRDQLQVFVRNLSEADDLSVDGQVLAESFVAPGELVVGGSVVVMVELLELTEESALSVDEKDRGLASQSVWAFYAALLRSSRYPFDGHCLFLLAGVGVVIGLSNLFVGILGTILGYFVGLYLLLMFREIIVSTIRGDDRMPSEPQINFDWDELKELIVPIYAIVLFPMLPFILVRFWTEAPDWLRPALGLAALFYIPMGMLLLIVTDEFWAAHPINIVRSILRAPGAYLGVLGLLLPIVGLGFLFDISEVELMRENRILGMVLATVLSLVECYFLFVWARALGLYYRWYRHSLQWEA